MVARLTQRPEPIDSTKADFANECRRRQLTFAGQHNERLDSFLREISTVRRQDPIADNDLLTFFPSLLTGAAHSLFEANRQRFRIWEDCTSHFRAVYLRPDYDIQLRRDLFLRTQCPNEKIDHFLSILENVNRTLIRPFSEPELVEIAVRNLHPRFLDAVTGRNFASIPQLAAASRLAEQAGELAKLYEPPPARLLADPMFAPQAVNPPKLAPPAPARFQANTAHSSAQDAGKSEPSICFTCRKPGHMSRECPSKPRVAAVETYAADLAQLSENENGEL